MKSYTLTSTTVKVTGEKAKTRSDSPKLVYTFDKTGSKATKTVVSATCPDLGRVYLWFAPNGTAAPTVKKDTHKDVKEPYEKYAADVAKNPTMMRDMKE